MGQKELKNKLYTKREGIALASYFFVFVFFYPFFVFLFF